MKWFNKNTQWFNKKTFSILLAIIFVFFGVQILYSFNRHRLIAPVIMTPSYIHTQVIDDDIKPNSLHAGQGIFIRTTTKRIQLCSVESQYSIVQLLNERTLPDGEIKAVRIIWYAYPLARNTTLIGDAITDKYLILPSWLQPGDYFIVRLSDYYCDGEKITQGERIPFRID